MKGLFGGHLPFDDSYVAATTVEECVRGKARLSTYAGRSAPDPEYSITRAGLTHYVDAFANFAQTELDPPFAALAADSNGHVNADARLTTSGTHDSERSL